MSNNVRTQVAPVTFGRIFTQNPSIDDEVLVQPLYINHETQLKIELSGINGDLIIFGSLKGSSTSYILYAGTGTDLTTIDISGYDCLTAISDTPITQGMAAFSTFNHVIVNASASTSDATAANQVTSNNLLNQIELNQDAQTTVLNTIATNTNTTPQADIALVDKTSTVDVIYVGEAAPGSSVASAVWKITRIDKRSAVTTILLADGNALKDNIWNNRLSGSYS